MSAREDRPYVRRTPDGAREVPDMLVPIPGRVSQMVLLRGAGLPTAVCVGSPDLSAGDWLRIVNRDVRAPGYGFADFVAVGMVRLDPAMAAARPFHLSGRSGASFAVGTADPAHVPADVPEQAMSREEAGPTCCWLVTDAEGPKMFAFPLDGCGDTEAAAEVLAPFVVGDFCVERIDTATVRAADDMFVPGWGIALDPGEAPAGPGLH